jgi:hypothetical protein
MVTSLKEKQYDQELELMRNGGGDGPDWLYISGYKKCIEDLEKLIQEEDNV